MRFATLEDLPRITEIVNHPSIRAKTGVDGFEKPDAARWVRNGNKCVLLEQGCFLFANRGGGDYTVHTDLLPGLRGKAALEAAREAMTLIFLETDATTLWTIVPGHNRAAAAFTCMMGFEFRFVRERLLPMGGDLRDARFYSRTIENWIESGVCANKGKLFHVKLPKKFHTHADDATHNAYVGAVLDMAKKQPEKAARIYNRQARFALYQQVALLPTLDNSILVDGGTFLIRVRGDDFDIEEKHQ